MNSASNLDTLTRDAGNVSDPTPDQLLTSRRRLDTAVRAAETRVVTLRRRRSPRRWTIPALAGAAAVTTALLVVPLASPPSASAEQVLLVTAQAAGQQHDRSVGASYWYVRSETDTPQTEPMQREIWQGRNAASILRDEALTPGREENRSVDPSHVRTEAMSGPATFLVGGDSLTWAGLETLPTDPDELGELLRNKVAGHHADQEFREDDELWESVTGLLRESPASPALRQALWEVAAHIPDVELVGPMSDAIGRRGTAIERNELDQGWYRLVYIVDPATGTLLESRYVDSKGESTYRTTQLAEEPRASAPQAQPPLCGPGSQPERSC